MDIATKTGTDAAKTASKKVVQKTAEATKDLVGNKIANKITSVGKSKEKEKTKEVEEIDIPPKKDNKLLMSLNSFEHKMNKMYKSGISKNCKFPWYDFWW